MDDAELAALEEARDAAAVEVATFEAEWEEAHAEWKARRVAVGDAYRAAEAKVEAARREQLIAAGVVTPDGLPGPNAEAWRQWLVALGAIEDHNPEAQTAEAQTDSQTIMAPGTAIGAAPGEVG